MLRSATLCPRYSVPKVPSGGNACETQRISMWADHDPQILTRSLDRSDPLQGRQDKDVVCSSSSVCKFTWKSAGRHIVRLVQEIHHHLGCTPTLLNLRPGLLH
mmetsp:Transcript_10988/g.13290  ORF Transcript_10988/g.13290 Transcript_10988/m.13290 type:complete len:103 (+) Transcript_10988:100-408(+)